MDISWHPALQALVGGILIGLASWLLLASLGRVAGISGIVSALIPGKAKEQNTWRIAFVGGLLMGGSIMSQLLPSASAKSSASEPLLITAGLLVGVGTVLSSGCTSGHGVCGLARLSLRSLIAVLTFMAVGMITVSFIHYFK